MHSEEAATAVAGRLSPEAVAYAGLSLMTLGWASAFIAGKVALAEITPLPTAAARYTVAATVLLPFAWRQQRIQVALRGVLGPLALMVVCGGMLYPWLFLLALSRTSATNAALLIALNPVLTLLLSPLVGERLDRRRLSGVALALFGAVTVITGGKWEHVVQLATQSFKSGDVLAVAAAASWACFNLAAQRVVTRLTASFTNCAVYGLGALTLWMAGYAEHPWAQLSAASSGALASILMMAVVSSVIAGQLFLHGVRTVGVNRTVVFVYLVPVLTAVLSVLLLGEHFQLAQAVGGAGVLAGVYWTTRRGTD